MLSLDVLLSHAVPPRPDLPRREFHSSARRSRLTSAQDYGNPQKWGEPGFASFIVALCCLSSRHIDDPRVRADPNDGVSAGSQWFELFGRLRSLPSADRPTLYTIQAVLIAGVYAVGAGKLSKAFALLSEAITLSVDAGIHRCADAYDYFDPVEEEVRKRTFWCVYLWDKQASAHFGRPPMVRLRDCDVREPAVVDDEFLSSDGPASPAPGRPESESRMFAFVCVLRLFVVLESVVDAPPSRYFGESSPFLTRATGILAGFRRHKELREEEALLDEVCAMVPAYWKHSPETMASDDVLRVTQAERLHCMEQFVRMLIHRHRFSELVADRTRTGSEEQSEAECDAIRAAHACALQIVSSHLHIGLKGMMTWCELLLLELGVHADGLLSCIRWRPCHPSAHAGRSHAHRRRAQQRRGLAARPKTAFFRRPAVLRRPPATVLRPVRLRNAV
jgi:hypothetical protein